MRLSPKQISTRAPREGSDAEMEALMAMYRDFNPRSPRGERPFANLGVFAAGEISTRAPREGSDGDG